jgi:branched-chain amino acid aminotransferase
VSTPVLTRDQYFQALSQWQKPYHNSYLAMYSSQWGGIVTDPALWNVPADDHIVHRGDGAFEVFKCVNGRAYCMDDHLAKLAATADRLAIKKPAEFDRLRDIITDTVRAGGEKDALVRLILSRGPGGFTSSPYESPVGLLFVNVLRLGRYNDEKYAHGVKAISAALPAKEPAIVTMKICSYVQNVLVKKEALDAGADYAISFGRDGFLSESSTENVAIVSKKRELLAPNWGGILKGSTLTRLMELGRGLAREGFLADARHQDVSREDVRNAAEAFICSTTTDVLPITTWDGQPLGDGCQGPVSKELLARMRAEYTDPASPFLTELF